MSRAALTIDLDAIAANWRVLAAMGRAEAGAVVKADAYGLGAAKVGPALARAGARRFFVALAEEGADLRAALGRGPEEIYVLSGHMAGDASLLREAALIPLLNTPEQWTRHREALPGHPFGVQLDTGMHRLGLEAKDFRALRSEMLAAGPRLLQSHLACADEPGHPANARQLARFRDLTADAGVPCSLAATGGILLGPEYHFDLTRPGIGLYGGRPFTAARAVVRLDLPVIQRRRVAAGESVGYGCTWTAGRDTRTVTLAAGYADGILRSLSGRATLWAGDVPCPLVGRVSMDLLTVDVTHLAAVPDHLTLVGPHQGIDDLADAAGTIGYEVLTSLGARYARRYSGRDETGQA
ncbi:MAG: alanine racemase [Alphaproteobacteria bacterium HGW-Alphaproteobacteria-2]|nr:MAG: alanine racemase [Alphaproteobacteria bacterium HGW-Alphaproteobacteria-2]